MRILLLSPKGPLYRHRGGIFRKSLRYAPLTLPTLASLIPPEIEHELTIIDEGVDDVPLDFPADLVGITVITGTAPRAYEIAAAFRARGISVVLGGPHVTLVPDDAQPHADSIVVGYAEDTWPELLRDFVAGAMRPRYVQAPDFSLANRPRVDRTLAARHRYATSHVFEATRGCVHGCEFCVVPFAWGRDPYQKPIEDVVEDIRASGARQAIFIDLNIIADLDYAARLFEALIPLNITWYGLSTTLLADKPDLLELCVRSGCRGLLIGLESISKGGLREVRKGFNDPARYPELIRLLHARGIALMGTFVFGLDDDRPDVFEKTAEFVIECGIDLPRFAIVTPFPGTAMYRRMEAEGRLLTRDWELYDGQHVVFRPAHMTVQQLEQGNRAAWRRAYSWRGIWRRYRDTTAATGLYLAANLGYRHYARNLDRFYTCDWFVGSDAGSAGPLAARAAKGAAR
ncbi:B12-binding domain-containing radical SAM protein [Neoroseomonas oryzicola]|uniref:B12-binding domain-containing radical SAM protein n=1 Tax=Neoroseomonas oryzicola TaxID=535904 RepID=A0A9X9WJY8_9PROT|nr:radical SAM protein [Neoroseomonas oryzicola]MBR0660648.1 B12-binding domain-containing radical SAM protein [Neoroseomonas oryzicola]NKE19994.1 B12-binding domain-containing radical SAM protein [Neoroseomonas oryzicola]